jgi:tetratricopeptide (TPR) repeat protein
METNPHPMTESLESSEQSVSEELERTHLESTNRNQPMGEEVVGTSSDMGQSQTSEELAKTCPQSTHGEGPKVMETAETSTREAGREAPRPSILLWVYAMGNLLGYHRVETVNQNQAWEILQETVNKADNMVAQGDWASAIEHYTACIDFMKTLVFDRLDFDQKTHSDKVCALCYTCRAECRLNQHEYKEAMDDAEEALRLELSDVGSFVRVGRAAHGLAMCEKACRAYKKALDSSSVKDIRIVNLLQESVTALNQSGDIRVPNVLDAVSDRYPWE